MRGILQYTTLTIYSNKKSIRVSFRILKVFLGLNNFNSWVITNNYEKRDNYEPDFIGYFHLTFILIINFKNFEIFIIIYSIFNNHGSKFIIIIKKCNYDRVYSLFLRYLDEII